MLNFAEADLFMRAGEDLRRAAWPAGDFLRRPEGPPKALPGYVAQAWTPTPQDEAATDWRRA